MECLLGIDLGTTGCRSIIYDRKLHVLREEYVEYSLIHLDDRSIEQDAGLWWKLTVRCMQNVLKKAGAAQDIRGIGISSQGISFVPVDERGEPLYNALTWLDTRAAAEANEVLKVFPMEKLYKTTGKRATEAYVLPKLLWLKKHAPQVYGKTYKFLTAHDYLLNRLCGVFLTDHTMASGTMLYDVHSQDWSGELLGAFEIEREKLPDIVWSGTAAGRLKSDLARMLGLREDVVVSVGGQDQKCAAFGAGIDEGIVTLSLGTACAIEKNYNFPFIDEKMRISCFSGLFKDQWVAEGVVGTAAASLRWIRDAFFPKLDYDTLSDMAEKGLNSNAALFFYPHLAGGGSPLWIADAAGVYYGIRLNTCAEDFVAALFEGVAFQIKGNLLAMGKVDPNISRLRVFGGGSKSAVWCDVLADVTGYPVEVPFTAETACAGAAILAGIGSGIYNNLEEAKANLSMIRTHWPDEKRHMQYEKKYQEYIYIERKIWD